MSRLRNVNNTDILDAIRLGCRTMCSVFNADDNNIPFFASTVLPHACLSFSPNFSEAHVPGRHLNALLNARHAAGIAVNEDAVQKHADAAFFSYSGPLPLPLNRAEINGPLTQFRPHNVREGFHALFALVWFRHSDRARALAEASIAAILDLWNPAAGWDRERLTRHYRLHLAPEATFITGLARAIGPLVKYYRATGHGPALQLALLLKDKAISEFFTETGDYDPKTFGTHTHSTTCVMSSLAQLADLTDDMPLLRRVKAFYDNGLWKIRDPLGWVIENSGPDSHPDHGEINNTGDIVETALILARRGYPHCRHDAESILRGHLLPSQLRDISFIHDPPNPENDDGKRNVAARHLGAFGFPAPYGHRPLGYEVVRFNMDIVGGAVGSLCEVYRNITRFDATGHHVNLLFDHETDAISVHSPYTHPVLQVQLKRPGSLFVRIPPWLVPEAVVVRGLDSRPRRSGDNLFIARPPVGRPLAIEFALPSREITLAHRTRQIRVRLRGDEVVAMDNYGADLTYFESIE